MVHEIAETSQKTTCAKSCMKYWANKPASKKVTTVLSARKVMGTIFWDSQDVICIEYLVKGKTVTGLYQAPKKLPARVK